MTLAQEIGERLRQLRREKAAKDRRDVEVQEVAVAVGVSTAAYSRYENGKRKPEDSVLLRLATYFKTSRSFIRHGEVIPAAVEDLGEDITEEVLAENEARLATTQSGKKKRKPRKQA